MIIKVKTFNGFGPSDKKESAQQLIDKRINDFLITIKDPDPKITWRGRNNMFYAMVQYKEEK